MHTYLLTYSVHNINTHTHESANTVHTLKTLNLLDMLWSTMTSTPLCLDTSNHTPAASSDSDG